jgi:hypothetical protein
MLKDKRQFGKRRNAIYLEQNSKYSNFVFIYCLLNDTAIISDYKTLNGRIRKVTNQTMWKEEVVFKCSVPVENPTAHLPNVK